MCRDAGRKYDLEAGEEPQYIPRDFRITPLVARLNQKQRKWLATQPFMVSAPVGCGRRPALTCTAGMETATLHCQRLPARCAIPLRGHGLHTALALRASSFAGVHGLVRGRPQR